MLILTSTSVSSSTLKNLKVVSCGPLNLPSLSSKFENLSSLRLVLSEIDDSTTAIPEDALQGLPNLEKLAVFYARKHHLPEKWSRHLNSLTELYLSHCNIRICLSEGWLRHLTSLEELAICWSEELVDFAEEFKHLNFLKRLELQGVDDMVSLPQSLQRLPSLQSLSLHELPQLSSLPDWLPNLASLTTLIIEDFPKIQSLPSNIRGMTNLRCLEIRECPQLKRQCEKPNGEDWPNIAYIPRLNISSPY
ncbi:hypothetical protein ACS0TY_023188 [Phlomoides rotata]